MANITQTKDEEKLSNIDNQQKNGKAEAPNFVQARIQKIEDDLYAKIANDVKNKLTEDQQKVWETELVQRLFRRVPVVDPFPKEVQLKHDENNDSNDVKNKSTEQFKIVALIELMKSAEIEIPQKFITEYVAKHGADVYNYEQFKHEVVEMALQEHSEKCKKEGHPVDKDLIVALDKNEKEISNLKDMEQCEEFVENKKRRFAKNLINELEGKKEDKKQGKNKDEKDDDLINDENMFKTIELIQHDKLKSMLVNTVLQPRLYLPAVLPVLNLIPFVGPLVSLYTLMKILPLPDKHVNLTKKVNRVIGNALKKQLNARMSERGMKFDAKMSEKFKDMFDAKMFPKSVFDAKLSEATRSATELYGQDVDKIKEGVKIINSNRDYTKQNEKLLLDMFSTYVQQDPILGITKNDGPNIDIKKNSKNKQDIVDILHNPIQTNTVITGQESGEYVSIDYMANKVFDKVEECVQQQEKKEQELGKDENNIVKSNNKAQLSV